MWAPKIEAKQRVLELGPRGCGLYDDGIDNACLSLGDVA